MALADLEAIFPSLRAAGYRITSPEDEAYNCFAWAAGGTHRWWYPRRVPRRHYWPPGVPEFANLDGFTQALAAVGFEICANGDFEDGFEKIAIYTRPDGRADGTPVHAARQIRRGVWTSKIGDFEDIEHYALDCFDNPTQDYGAVACFMRRRSAGPEQAP